MALSCNCSNMSVRGLVTCFGCMMVIFCLGLEITFSNMNPYTTSYMRNRSEHSHDVSYGDTLWVATGNVISTSLFMPILCMLEQILPSRLCILIGTLTCSGAEAVTYFSLHNSFIAVIFTDGVVFAMGKALFYPISMRLAFRWFPKRKGIISGILLACYGGSAFAFTQIETKFINPDNLSPDQEVNDDRYFTQSSLLDKVPYCYLLIAGIFAVISTICVLIMTDPGEELRNNTYANDKGTSLRNDSEQNINKEGPNIYTETEQDEEILKNMSPMETLKTGQFYVVFLMYFFFGFGQGIFTVLYKPYGETFITDDYFLSLVASFAAVSVALGTLSSGFLADRFTYKPVLMMLVCIFGTFLATFDATELGGKPMYFIWVCVMHFFFSGVFVLLPIIVLDMFGSKHFSVNYGLVHSSGIAFSLLSALLTSQLKETVGWHGIFLIAAGTTIMSFLLTFVLYIKNWDLNK